MPHGIKEGRVKFFKKDKGWGFIETDEGDIFFHAEYFSEPIEDIGFGELTLEFSYDEHREPKSGDGVMLDILYSGPKGPMAVHWCFKDQWQKALAVIGQRVDPEVPWTRVIDERKGHIKEDQVIWEGTYREFERQLELGEVPGMESDSLAIFLQVRKVQGWETEQHPRCWHPKYQKFQPVY